MRFAVFYVILWGVYIPVILCGFEFSYVLAVVTLQTFTQVKQIYLVQIHQKFPEVNSSRVLFYIGKKFWEGHTTDISSQGFHAQLNILTRESWIQESKMLRDLADQRDVFSL